MDYEAVVVFKIDHARHSIPRDLLRSIPSSLSTAVAAVISSENTFALDDVVMLVEQNTPDVKTFDVVFHMLIHGTSASHLLTTSTQQVKLGNSTKKIKTIDAASHAQVTLDFDLLANSIVLTTAITAQPITDFLKADLADEFSTVALTYEQFKKLFQSQNPVLQDFLVEWLFDFPRPGFRSAVCQNLVQKAMNLAGFPAFISQKMDELDHDNLSEAAWMVASEVYNHLPDKERRGKLPEDVAEARQTAAVTANDPKQARKRKAEHVSQKDNDKGVKFPKQPIERVANTRNVGTKARKHARLEPANDSSSASSDLSVYAESTPDPELGSSRSNQVSDKHDGSVAIDSHAAGAHGLPKKIVTLKYPARLAGRVAAIGKTPATNPTRDTAPTLHQAKAQEPTPIPTLHPVGTSHPGFTSGRVLWQQPKIGEKSPRDQPLYSPDRPVSGVVASRKANPKPKSKKPAIAAPVPIRVQPTREKKARAAVKYEG